MPHPALITILIGGVGSLITAKIQSRSAADKLDRQNAARKSDLIDQHITKLDKLCGELAFHSGQAATCIYGKVFVGPTFEDANITRSQFDLAWTKYGDVLVRWDTHLIRNKRFITVLSGDREIEDDLVAASRMFTELERDLMLDHCRRFDDEGTMLDPDVVFDEGRASEVMLKLIEAQEALQSVQEAIVNVFFEHMAGALRSSHSQTQTPP